MPVAQADSAAELAQAIERYNAAWNAHDLDAIVAMHAPDMVFANHTAGESAEADEVRATRCVAATWSRSRPGGSWTVSIMRQVGLI